MAIKNDENYDRIMNNFDSTGRIGWGMGVLAGVSTYTLIKRANKYLVDQGYGKEYSWLNAGIKLAGVYLATDVGINVAYMVGHVRAFGCKMGKYFVEELKRRKESLEEEVETNGDGTTSES